MMKKILFLLLCVVLSVVGSYVLVRFYFSLEPSFSAQFPNSDNTTSPSVVSRASPPSIDFTQAAQMGIQGVVNIEVQVQNQRTTSRQRVDFFDFFFGPQPQQPQQPQGFQAQGAGSGVIISPSGHIVTNNHVINGAQRIRVTLNSGESYFAELVGTDPSTDIALLKVTTAEPLPYLKFGDSSSLKLGEWVLAVGNPFGLNSTVTAGIVSAKGRSLGVNRQNRLNIESFIQTDAAVNPGNSGGALINTNGELVGINTLIKSPTGSFAGYSFAVPAEIAQKITQDLIEFGKVQKALLGVAMQEIDREWIENFGQKYGVKDIGGVFVAEVTPGGAAQKAGIKQGDIIVQVDSLKIMTPQDLQAHIATLSPGDKINIFTKNTPPTKPLTAILRNTSGN